MGFRTFDEFRPPVQYRRGEPVPMKLADMTEEQRRVWRNVMLGRAQKAGKAKKRAASAEQAGGKPKPASMDSKRKVKAEAALRANQAAREAHQGAPAQQAARELQRRGHVVYSLAIMGETYGGPGANLWVVDWREYPVPVSTLLEWARSGVPTREQRIAAAVPRIRPKKVKAKPIVDRATQARHLLDDAMRRHGMTRNQMQVLVGESIFGTLENGGTPTPRTLSRIEGVIAALDGRD